MTVLTCEIPDPVNTSWAALNAKSAGERSITIALMVMAANAAGIIGSQLFRENDKPLYVKGWTAILVVVTVGLVASVFANMQYFFLNRRQKRVGGRTYHP